MPERPEMLESSTSLSPSEINGATNMGEKAWTGSGGRRRKSRGKKSKKTVGGKKSRRTGKKAKKSSKSKSRKSRRR